jgi:AcrR family transcriptional regulator
MPRRPTSAKPTSTAPQRGRKGTQKERLLSAMVTVSSREGYARASVSAVIAQAGVSRPTFYDYFTDREDCFLAALADIQDQLLGEVRLAVAQGEPQHACHTAVRAVIGFASSQPAAARFLINEAMAGGPLALDARDRGITEIAQVIEAAQEQAPATATIPDIAAAMLIGGVYRLLAARLRRGEPGISGLLEDLLHWVSSYEQPARESRWRTLRAATPPPRSPFVAYAPLRVPTTLPPGRPRLSAEEVAESHRQRILFATAEIAEKKGYGATTIAQITKRAGVDGRVFYALFADKQDAFMAVHELGFHQVMAVTAGAFFSATTWPERTWEAGRAFAQFLEDNPTIGHVGFVEAYAVGPGAVQRVEDSHIAFTILLQEGYRQEPLPKPPSRLALEAIITTIFEIVYHQVRASAVPQIAGLLGHMTFLCLTPFIGPAAANGFIEQKLNSGT